MNTADIDPAAAAALRLAGLLEKSGRRLVLAESCTGGLAAALLAAVPGVSRFFCGSAVVYREDTKTRWLGVDAVSLREEGAVSRTVAAQMAEGALERTPEADLALSITGDLGPGAPAATDGRVFVGMASRTPGGPIQGQGVAGRLLASTSRGDRQREAAQLLLEIAGELVA